MNLYNTIQKVLNTASSHILVNEVGEGDIYEYLNSGEHKYPCVFLTVTSVVDNEYTRNINGTLFYVDRLLANQSNKTSIQSVAVSVLRDMLQALNVDVDTIEYNTFTEKFTDLCAGAYVDCQIPIDFTSLCEDNFEMKVKSITENGIYEIEGYSAVDVKVVPKVVLGNELKLAYSTYTEVPDNFDFSQTTDFSYMFTNCTELTKVPTIDTSNNTNFDRMFLLCHKIRTIPYLDTSNGGVFNHMFDSCWNLETITHLDTTQGKLFDFMFSSCESLEVIGGELDFSNGGTYLTSVFGVISSQAPVKLREVRFKGSINGTISFYCPALSYDSIKSILTACANKTSTSATTITFSRTIADNNGELANLIAQCNAKNWTITGLTLT